jgi:predicted transposase/invertase (TIGR01784 family)
LEIWITPTYRTEGHAEGLSKGHAEKAIEVARNLKKMGLSVSQIAEATGLSLEEVIRC